MPEYDFPAYRAVNHRLLDMPLRTSALRSLGAFLNVFAAESFMDELALAVGRDPVDTGSACLSDPRARAVIESAARRSGWDNWSPAESAGHGIGFARYKNTSAYCAVVADVEAVSEVRVRRLTIAVDAGLVINPGRCREPGRGRRGPGHQLGAEGTGALRPVRRDQRYLGDIPYSAVLRGPAVDVELLPGNGNPALGVGETAQGPTAAAIGNALCNALEVRVRTLPFTEANIVAAMRD